MELEMLPKDLLVGILVRVDIKSLIRLSCVCKAWRVLILETPHFGDLHLNHWKQIKNNDYAVYLRNPSGDDVDKIVTYDFRSHQDDSHSLPLWFEDLELPLQSADRHLRVRHCNGILCISEGVAPGIVHLCNPTTLEHLLLPPGLFDDGEIYRTENLGFGFDQSSNDYKVVRIKCGRIRRHQRRMKHVEIYRVSTNSWSELSVNSPPQGRIYGRGVFLNGFFHWWGINDQTSKKIVTFDFQRERFGEIKCHSISSAPKAATIDVLGDSLVVCSMSRSWAFQMWMMKEYGNPKSGFMLFSVQWVEPTTYWFHDSDHIAFRHPNYLVVSPVEKEQQEVGTKSFEYDTFPLRGTSSTVFRPSLVSLRNRMLSQRFTHMCLDQ